MLPERKVEKVPDYRQFMPSADPNSFDVGALAEWAEKRAKTKAHRLIGWTYMSACAVCLVVWLIIPDQTWLLLAAALPTLFAILHFWLSRSKRN